MKKIIIVLLSFVPLMINAQEKEGISFERNMSWRQVVEKAKRESKYIFVDCYASWCGPCKLMDKNVYVKEKIGNIVNDKFVSVKVQMDSTKNDDSQTREWYAVARDMQRQYNINAFPTYLFFSPEGKIVHKGEGYKNEGDFIATANAAVNPNTQYYTLLENYRKGNKEYSKMAFMATTAKTLKDAGLADSIAADYIDNYLLNLPEDKLYTKENIKFIAYFIRSSKVKFFRIFYPSQDKVDSVMGEKGYGKLVVDYIINHEEITPELNAAINNKAEPDWHKISEAVSSKYTVDYADRNLLGAKVRFYQYNTKKYNENWPEYLKYAVLQTEQNGTGTTNLWQEVYLNNLAWDVFQHSKDKKLLKTVTRWMMDLVRRHPDDAGYCDTYANLLYKSGKKKDGIAMEDQASKLSPKSANYQATLAKMQKGEPTWPH
jgi:thioredoxin-related protein